MSAYTLKAPVTLAGVGLHTGLENRVTLSPRTKAGIEIFINGQPLPLTPINMQPTPLCTLLVAGAVQLSTPEHLFAALHGLHVLGVKLEVVGPADGCEIPILDGSALPWVEAIDAAGRTEITAPLPLVVRAPVTYSAEGRVLVAVPRWLGAMGGGLQAECHINFPHPAIGAQSWQGVVTEEVFRTQIAPARSFGVEADLKAAMAAGLLKGASLNSGVLFTDAGGVANPEGLRFTDEPVRHKVLDFLGDSFLAGRVVQGAFTLNIPGHTANNALLRKIIEQEEA